MKNQIVRLTFLAIAPLCVLSCAHQPTPPAQAPLPTAKVATPTGPEIVKAIASLPPDVRATCLAAAVSAQTAAMHLAETAQQIRTCLASRDLPIVLRVSMLEALAMDENALQNKEAALEAQSAAIDLESAPSDMELFSLANLYDDNHRYKEGFATLDRIRLAHEAQHDLDSTFGAPYDLELGKNLAATGHPHEAIDAFSKAIAAAPAWAIAYRFRAEQRELIGDKDGARADCIEFARWAPEASVDAAMRAKLTSMGIDAEYERRHPFGHANPLLELADQSIKDAHEALRTAGTAQAKAQAYWDLSDALDNRGQGKEALAAIDKAIALAPSDVRFQQSKVTTLVGMHRIDDALAVAAPLFKRMHDDLSAAKNPVEVHHKYVELTSSAVWAYFLKGDWPNAVAMMADTAMGSEEADQDYLASLYLIVRARSNNAVPANAFFEDYLRRSTFKAEAGYRRALLQYVRGRMSLNVVYTLIDLMPMPAARQNALAETWMMAAAYERFVKHDDAAARVFKERINDLQPYGTNEWTMVKYGAV